MGDVMLFGILRMPYDMAMANEISRHQYWQSGQQAAQEIERLREALRVYSCSCSEEVASNCRVDECGWIAQTALQQKDSE